VAVTGSSGWDFLHTLVKFQGGVAAAHCGMLISWMTLNSKRLRMDADLRRIAAWEEISLGVIGGGEGGGELIVTLGISCHFDARPIFFGPA
jgi:hypothetical protein